jgi:hypothetical protein
MRPRYIAIAKKISTVDFTELDYDMDSELIGPLNIGKILPVAIGQIDGSEVFRLIGEKSIKVLETALNGYFFNER